MIFEYADVMDLRWAKKQLQQLEIQIRNKIQALQDSKRRAAVKAIFNNTSHLKI
jgi:hypothetical protein